MFKIIALVLLGLSFLFKLFMLILDYRSKNNEIPQNVQDIYDPETYQKWRNYHSEGVVLSLVFLVINFVLNFSLLFFNVFSYFANLVSSNPYIQSLIVIAILIILSTIIDVIDGYFTSFKLEAKYGFNKATKQTFIADQIKGFITSTLIMVGLIMLFTLIYTNLGDWTLLLFTGIMIIIILIVMALYPTFSKMYNKFTPLEDGELRTRLTELLTKYNYKIKEIKVMDASKRTTKSNAYFSGLGSTKTIVLYDNLLESMTIDEIVAVFAHELGHGLHKDIIKNYISTFINIITIVVVAWLLSKYPSIYEDFGFNNTVYANYSFAFILMVFSILPFLNVFLGLFSQHNSRKAEYKADNQAVKEGYGKELISALKKLSRENFSNLAPNKLEVLLSYSHPTTSDRIRKIEEAMNNKNE